MTVSRLFSSAFIVFRPYSFQKFRKWFLAFSLATAVGPVLASGPGGGVDERIISAFEKDFPAATNVHYDVRKDYVKVSFRLDSTWLEGFYDWDGTQVAISRDINADQLPVKLRLDLYKRFPQFEIREMLEMASESGGKYFVRIRNASRVLILEADSDRWQLYNRS